jgi:hypothetical protein
VSRRALLKRVLFEELLKRAFFEDLLFGGVLAA